MSMKIKNIPFIGGDTMKFEYDFATKVVESTTECPLKIYLSAASTLQAPTNITSNVATGWREINSQFGRQAWIDKIKFLGDDQYLTYNVTASGQMAQMMIELDLAPLNNSLYGSSTSDMQTALKSKIFSAYARGSGSNSGTQTYLCKSYIWNNTNGAWDSFALNDTNLLKELAFTETCKGSDRINSSNKIYFLLASGYASDGTNPSSIDLKYTNIKLSFTRVPDVIAPIPLTLPSTWSMLVKGFSPAWNSLDKDGIQVKIFDMYNYALVYDGSLKKFLFENWDGNSLSDRVYSDVVNFDKFQSINLLVEQTTIGLRLRILESTSSVQKYSLLTSSLYNGNKSLYLLQNFQGTGQADAFINSVLFFANRLFEDDTEAEGILSGTKEGFEEDESFDISKVNLHANAKIQGNSIVLNATDIHQNSTITIPVLPNNQYELKFQTNIDGNSIWITEQCGVSTQLIAHTTIGDNTAGSHSFNFMTNIHANKLYIMFTNDVATGHFTWSNISLRLKM